LCVQFYNSLAQAASHILISIPIAKVSGYLGSLLVAIHDIKELATTISLAFEPDEEDAFEDSEQRDPPSIERVRGVLGAIEGQTGGMHKHCKVNICQTSGNKVARWRALLTISAYRKRGWGCQYFPVFLKGQETCIACTLVEALVYETEPCFLVL
jgi:hypothetical protein